MDKEVPELMGVAKAIIENVVFCHQEDANWPLSDSSTLKKKFDDIFAATKFAMATRFYYTEYVIGFLFALSVPTDTRKRWRRSRRFAKSRPRRRKNWRSSWKRVARIEIISNVYVVGARIAAAFYSSCNNARV